MERPSATLIAVVLAFLAGSGAAAGVAAIGAGSAWVVVSLLVFAVVAAATFTAIKEGPGALLRLLRPTR